MTAYILQSLQNTNLCIGVTSTAPGTFVTLKTLSGAGDKLSQWSMDPNTGVISLASDPTLCLDVQGYDGKQGQVIIATWVIGRTSQQWNWLGAPPTISNVQYPNMVLDNANNTVAPGNAILIWPLNGGTNQKWSKLAVPALELLAEAVQ
jgi:hypothetical protein